MRRSGFTLVELLITVAVIITLAGISVPVYHSMIARGKATHCANNLRQIGVALNIYLAENNNRFPTLAAARTSKEDSVDVMDTVFAPYVDNLEIFRCKGDDKNFYEETGNSYFWNSTLNGQPVTRLNFLGIVDDKGGIPVVSDKENFHLYRGDEVNILYADGHADKNLILKVD